MITKKEIWSKKSFYNCKNLGIDRPILIYFIQFYKFSTPLAKASDRTSFRTIPKSVSEPIRVIPSQSEKSFQSRL